MCWYFVCVPANRSLGEDTLTHANKGLGPGGGGEQGGGFTRFHLEAELVQYIIQMARDTE